MCNKKKKTTKSTTIDSISEIPILCIRKLGFTPSGTLTNYVGVIGIVLQILVPIGMINFCVQNRNDLFLLLEGVGFVLSNFESIARWYTLLRTSDLYQLNESVKELYKECESDDRKVLQKVNITLNKIIKAVGSLCICTTYGFVIFPILNGVLNVYFKRTEETLTIGIPYGAQLPFVSFDANIIFWPWFAALMFHGLNYIVLEIIVLGLLAVISINLGEQMKVLQRQFQNSDFSTMEYSKIRRIIAKHKKIIYINTHLKTTFKVCLFTQCLSGSMHLCAIAYRIAVYSSINDILVLIPYCMNLLSNLFVVCHSGQVIAYEVSSKLRLISNFLFIFLEFPAFLGHSNV